MRIVIVISNLQYGGAETQVLALSRRLSALGHAVAIYTLNRNNPRVAELAGTGVTVVEDQKVRRLDLGVLRRLRRFLAAFRADIVHGFLFDGDLYSRLAAAGTGVPALNSERSDGYQLNLSQALIHWVSRALADGVVANSHSGRRFAQALYGFPEQRTHVVWNGIDLDVVDRRRVSAAERDYKQQFFGRSDVQVACLVANIKPDKDYLLALQTAERLTRDDPSWRVLFVGDALTTTGAYHSEIAQAFQQLGLEGRAVFAGRRPDVLEMLSQCEVLFCTSLREGFPNVVLEAMALGVPVASTDYSDIRQILPQPWQVVEQRSPEALAAAIRRCGAERASLSAMSRTWVEQQATIAVSAERLLAVYGHYCGAAGATAQEVARGRH